MSTPTPPIPTEEQIARDVDEVKVTFLEGLKERLADRILKAENDLIRGVLQVTTAGMAEILASSVGFVFDAYLATLLRERDLLLIIESLRTLPAQKEASDPRWLH